MISLRKHSCEIPGRWLVAGCCLHTLLTLLQHAWYWQQLPTRVATHFGAGGEPNDWMDKTPAALLLGGFQLFFPLLLLGIARLLEWIPNEWINLPHREYWLAPARRTTSLRWLETAMSGVAGLTACLLVATSHFTFRANLRSGKLEELPLLICLGIYLTGTLWLILRMLLRFRRKPTQQIRETPSQ